MDGVDVVIGTSSFLRKFSHGKDITYIIKTAIEVIEFVKSKGIEVRFSSEDSFRSDLVDLLSIYRAVDKIGVNRVGIADTVGCANPRQVSFNLEDFPNLAESLLVRSTISCVPFEEWCHAISSVISTTTLDAVRPSFSLSAVPSFLFLLFHRTLFLLYDCLHSVVLAVANAFCALEAGATHIDTSVLGIGERNGITVRPSFPASTHGGLTPAW